MRRWGDLFLDFFSASLFLPLCLVGGERRKAKARGLAELVVYLVLARHHHFQD